MVKFVVWYIVLFLIEFSFVIWKCAEKIKSGELKCLTVGDIISAVIIPALIVVLPFVLITLYSGEITDMVVWKKSK